MAQDNTKPINVFDPFNPLISEVVAGIEGKIILIYSDENKVGKTKVGTQLPKPYYLRFEPGLSAIKGVPYAPLTNWSEFKQLNRMLTDTRNLPKLKERYQTIIIDTFDAAIKWCDTFVCDQYGVKSIKLGNEGFGLWKEYEDEWFTEWNKLLNAGYTIYGISHADTLKKVDPTTGIEYNQLAPYGDKRTIKLIKDMADFCGYVQSNGLDENGKEIMSSIYFVETKHFVAGSRFEMPPKIEVFTAENLQNAIKEAMEKEGEDNLLTLEQTRTKEHQQVYDYETVIKLLSDLWNKLGPKHKEEINHLTEEYLGPNKRISETTEQQLDQLNVLLREFQALDKK